MTPAGLFGLFEARSRSGMISPPTEVAGRRSPHYPIGWAARLPYPVRNVLRRWRGLLGMMIGVGIALSVVTTLLAMSQGNIDI